MTSEDVTTTTNASTLDDEVRKFRSTDDDLLAEDDSSRRAHPTTDDNKSPGPVTFTSTCTNPIAATLFRYKWAAEAELTLPAQIRLP